MADHRQCLLAFEVNHYLNTKKWGKKGHMAVKLDISKAYDKCLTHLCYVVLSLALLFPKGGSVKNHSQAGKEILIKAVAQAIPTYAMGCFCLPASLIKEIQSMIANFWWHSGDTKKIHWLNWHKLSKQKLHGGLGFRDLQAFNLVMLAKQLWRIISNSDSLLSRVLRARYFPHGQVLEASVGRNPSFTWRILASQHVVRGGFRWCIGNSTSME
ncbi:UNVERIFIED_CONTAM: putative mitochondrial protein [Sesamum radiatum]|uniref:Mitochondrial protein n=1 Tax=Sesamum radiatum TaxID=300843 RepID=A0AAW2JPF8_SESRA